MEQDSYIFTYKFTLVPATGGDAMAMLALNAIFEIEEGEKVYTTKVEERNMIFAYAAPAIAEEHTEQGSHSQPKHIALKMLELAQRFTEYNKLVVSLQENFLYLCLMEGDKLITLNSYAVEDFNTALFYTLAALKGAQINPSQTKIRIFKTKLEYNQLERFGTYFKRAEII
ncbi:MAG: DUF3822 family protein [Candidatus Egerieousia sp.]|nr:DUF3822 family protein [Candidatus Egerieousia sp.]